MKKLLSLAIIALLCNVAFTQIDTTVIFHDTDSLLKLGNNFRKKGDISKALEIYNDAATISKQVDNGYNIHYANTQYKIGYTYFNTNDMQNALIHFIQSMEIQKKVIGEDNPSYATILNNIGLIYDNMNDYQNALKYYIQAMQIRKKVIGEENIDYVTSLDNIGSTYYKIGDYQNAFDYFLASLEIKKKTFGIEQNYAASLNNIGILYLNKGDYTNALEYSKQALEIREKVLGNEDKDYINSLINVSNIYNTIGDYSNTLKYILQAMEIWERVYDKENPTYATILNNIGCAYYEMGEYQKALKYHLQAKEIREKTCGQDSPDYAASLDNIGNAYRKMRDYQNALKYQKQSIEIKKKIIGEEHPNNAISLNNIGNTYSNMKDYENAVKYQIKAMEIIKKVYGKEHSSYATILNNIGKSYSNMKDYENAVKYITEAMEIWEKVLGKEHPNVAQSYINLCAAYYNMKDFTNAIKASKQASNIRRNNLIRNFSFMTAQEREAYWNANLDIFISNIYFLAQIPDDTLATKLSYDSELIIKGLLLASEISMTNIIMESGDTALISEYETMKTAHLQLNKELERPIAERVYNCDSLENEIQNIERRIMEKSKEFGDVTHFIKIDWKEVQNSLNANDVAIEFTNFNENDTTRYLALMLTKDMEAPVCVPLFNQFEMQKLQRGIVPVKNETQMEDENRGATTVSSKRQGIYESTGLYNLLWKPLEKYFPENPRIYFAPSGDLHQIAVEYAPTGNGKTISDKYEIYRVSSTRFLAMDYMLKPFKNSVLYGGIYYDSDTTTMKQESDRYSTRNATSYTSFADFNRNEDRGSLNYLPGTKTEVEDIVGKLKKKRIKSQLFEGSAANEESFKALSGSDISVLHIATHGFFLPTDEKLSGDQSLIQSGLLLSGANYAWQNKPLPEGIEDGILTAKEISFMDLRKTDMVVLSACQTALGEITGEGVFGLQRGFKKAGARTIIMSLWPVDDNATLLMMTEFYSNLTKGMSKREAFLAAQNKVKTTAGFENPRYWAAFIMLDGNEK